ncbi:MAG: sensor histidine kinase [Firmicutes bacterium]|nr:sensor histidine kinase [Bacillota bacterium]
MKLNWLATWTLRRQMSISMIFLVISAVTAIGITSIKIAQEVVKNNTARFAGKMLTQAAYRLGSLINNAETAVDSLILDRRLAPLLNQLAKPENARMYEKARLALHDLLAQYKAALLPGTELTVIDPAGNMVTTYQIQLAPQQIVPGNLSDKPKTWRPRYFANNTTKAAALSGRLLELVARIVSLPGRSQSGWIILHLDYRMVESIMANISLQENTLSQFQSEVVVFGPEKQVIFPWVAPANQVLDGIYRKRTDQLQKLEVAEQNYKGDNYLVIMAPVPWTPWEVCISAPTRRLYTGLGQINNSILVIGLICSCVAVFFASLLSYFVIKPVNRLRKIIGYVEDGRFSVRAPEGGPLEIKTLGRAFNKMLGEVDRLTKRLVAEESERKTAVIKTLQAQIAPHFLFNTLTAITGMTAACPAEEVAEALRALKSLLYLSIGKSGDFVTLADEFEHISHYLYLMNIRYQERCILETDLPEELSQCRIVRLVLQPLVENCLQHGFKTRGGAARAGACIRVTAAKKGEDILIQVIDNGEGMTPEQLSAVWKEQRDGAGIGVRNVDERLKLSFGPDYGLSLTSIRGAGTTVSLRIPYSV